LHTAKGRGAKGWQNSTTLENSAAWKCAYCDEKVSSRLGYNAGTDESGSGSAGKPALIRICSNCLSPTFFTGDEHSPTAAPGASVGFVPQDVAALYHEARLSAGAGAHTSAVMTCRKILMHIAVEKGADEGQSFLRYVEFLVQNGYVPPGGSGWVDYVRTRANETNHDIVLMTSKDSEALVGFVEMLLKFIYELPSMVPGVAPALGEPEPGGGASGL